MATSGEAFQVHAQSHVKKAHARTERGVLVSIREGLRPFKDEGPSEESPERDFQVAWGELGRPVTIFKGNTGDDALLAGGILALIAVSILNSGQEKLEKIHGFVETPDLHERYCIKVGVKNGLEHDGFRVNGWFWPQSPFESILWGSVKVDDAVF